MSTNNIYFKCSWNTYLGYDVKGFLTAFLHPACCQSWRPRSIPSEHFFSLPHQAQVKPISAVRHSSQSPIEMQAKCKKKFVHWGLRSLLTTEVISPWCLNVALVLCPYIARPNGNDLPKAYEPVSQSLRSSCLKEYSKAFLFYGINYIMMFGWLVVFNVPLTARSFRDHPHLLSLTKDMKLDKYTIPTRNWTPGHRMAVHYVTPVPRKLLLYHDIHCE